MTLATIPVVAHAKRIMLMFASAEIPHLSRVRALADVRPMPCGGSVGDQRHV